MRARNIKPGFFKNAELADAGLAARLLFIGLWCMADREGRLKDKPRVIKAEVFPYDRDNEVDIDAGLNALERLGLIHRYSTTDKAGHASCIIQIANFQKHQSPHHTEKASELPAPVNSPLDNGEYPSDSLIPDSLNHDSLIPDSCARVVHTDKKATDVAAEEIPETDRRLGKREEAKRMWPRVLSAIQIPDLQKAFPPDSPVGKAVHMIGGWRKLGMKHRTLRGQTEQQFLNAYAEVA